MNISTFKCPSCGATLNIPEGRALFFCTYCGSQIHVDDGRIIIDINQNIKIDNRYTDVARLRELDLQEQHRKQLDEAERTKSTNAKAKVKNWWRYVCIFHGICAFFYLLCFYKTTGESVNIEGVRGIFTIGMIAAIIFSVQRPDHCYLEQKPKPKSRITLFWLLWLIGQMIAMSIGVLASALFITISK